MKINRYVFGAWSCGDRSFRTDLYLYDLRGCDPLIEKALEGNGEERICVHSIGDDCLLMTLNLCCWTLSSTAEEIKGEGYLITRRSFDDLLNLLEDWEVIESHEGYSARFRCKETVEI